MLSVPRFLNVYVGPFSTGALVAAVPTLDGALSVALVLLLAGLTGYMSLPGKDRLLARILRAAD